MENRDERRALSARRDIGVAEPVNDRQAGPVSGSLAVAQLTGEPTLWPMQHRLPMHSDQVDAFE